MIPSLLMLVALSARRVPRLRFLPRFARPALDAGLFRGRDPDYRRALYTRRRNSVSSGYAPNGVNWVINTPISLVTGSMKK